MMCIYPDKIPKKDDENFLDYCKNISMLYGFNAKQSVDIFKGRCVTILPILACIADLLATEYNG